MSQTTKQSTSIRSEDERPINEVLRLCVLEESKDHKSKEVGAPGEKYTYIVSVHKPNNSDKDKWETDAHFEFSDEELKIVETKDALEDMDIEIKTGSDEDNDQMTKVVNEFRLSYQCMLQLVGMQDDKIRDLVKLRSDRMCTIEEIDDYAQNFVKDKILLDDENKQLYSVMYRLNKRLEEHQKQQESKK